MAHNRNTAGRKAPNSSTRPAVLLVPGLSGSGDNHWQSRWENELPDCRKVDLGMWEDPHRNTWINKLNLAIHRANRPVVLVAHSLGCLVTAWWAKFEQPKWGDPVIGALLVAPPEVDFFPKDDRVSRFSPTPSDALPFPSTLVASRDDPWIGFNTARSLARRWNSDFVDAGELGHINADSGVGDWQFGQRLLDKLIGNTSHREAAPSIPLGRDWAPGLEYRA